MKNVLLGTSAIDNRHRETSRSTENKRKTPGKVSKKRKADDVSLHETKVSKPKSRSCKCTRCRSLSCEPVTKKGKFEKEDDDFSDFKSSLESVVTDVTGIVLEGMVHGVKGYEPRVSHVSSSDNKIPCSNDQNYFGKFNFSNLLTPKTETVILPVISELSDFKRSLESVLADVTSIVLEGMIHGVNDYKPKITHVSISDNKTSQNEALSRNTSCSNDQNYFGKFYSSNLSTPNTETVTLPHGATSLEIQGFSLDKVKNESEHVSIKPFILAAFKPDKSNELPEDSASEEDVTVVKQVSATTVGSLGTSGNIVGDNIIKPKSSKSQVRTGLRPVFIDGSNVAMSHSNGKYFSVRGLDMCIQFFVDRGHEMVIAFVPLFRRRARQTTDLRRLLELEDEGRVIFTPSRRVGDKLHICYDDRYTVQCAKELGGVIVSKDNFRDLKSENKAWVETINERLLMFTWVGDMLIFPKDPMGRHGISLKELLEF